MNQNEVDLWLERWAAEDSEKALEELMDPVRRPGKVRTLKDMSEEEIQALERQYGCPVRRPSGDK